MNLFGQARLTNKVGQVNRGQKGHLPCKIVFQTVNELFKSPRPYYRGLTL